ncbi:Conserved hypothetical protein [gamma proteobacterium HdN1]|nr:Conserved hypothetical protein [gamma proteobacterium HdN1]
MLTGARTRMEHRPIQLWVLHDHKPGHTSQLHGLVDRLNAIAAVEVRWVDATQIRFYWQDWLRKRWPEQGFTHAPDIVTGAGSASHRLILLARRVFGCMASVIMRPSIPLSLYDAAIVPRHDRPSERDNILITRGVMNTLKPREAGADAPEHTMLIGGESKHFVWSSEQTLDQIQQVLEAEPSQQWTITNSRRTPEEFGVALSQKRWPQVNFCPHTETPKGWVANQLTRSAQVWVTPDSVSMVYEAITSGAATGLFSLPPTQHGRIHEGLDQIRALKLYTPFEDWQQTHQLALPSEPLWEADRSARWLLERYDAWKREHHL